MAGAANAAQTDSIKRLLFGQNFAIFSFQFSILPFRLYVDRSEPAQIISLSVFPMILSLATKILPKR
jgi:hypothetical protein